MLGAHAAAIRSAAGPILVTTLSDRPLAEMRALAPVVAFLLRMLRFQHLRLQLMKTLLLARVSLVAAAVTAAAVAVAVAVEVPSSPPALFAAAEVAVAAAAEAVAQDELAAAGRSAPLLSVLVAVAAMLQLLQRRMTGVWGCLVELQTHSR